MSIEAQGVQMKRAGVLQKFDSSGEDKQLIETLMVTHAGEVLTTTEAITLDDALAVARDLAPEAAERLRAAKAQG